MAKSLAERIADAIESNCRERFSPLSDAFDEMEYEPLKRLRNTWLELIQDVIDNETEATQ